MNRRMLLRLVLPPLALGIGVVVVLRFTAGMKSVQSLPAITQPLLLIPAVALLVMTALSYALLWRSIICSIDPVRPRLADSCAVFCASWLGRYLPTSAAYAAGKIILGARLGHGRMALAASIVYENMVVVLVSLGVGAAALAIAARSNAGLIWLGAALGAGLLLALIPTPLARRALQRASSLHRRLAPLGACSLAPAATARATAIATGAAVINGAVFACVLGAFGSLTPRDAIIAAAAFNIAGAAGIAAVPVPSGIGVREAVLVTILHPIAPLEVIAGAAVLIRVAAIPMDVLLGALGAIWLAHRLPGADTLAAATPSQAEASAA